MNEQQLAKANNLQHLLGRKLTYEDIAYILDEPTKKEEKQTQIDKLFTEHTISAKKLNKYSLLLDSTYRQNNTTKPSKNLVWDIKYDKNNLTTGDLYLPAEVKLIKGIQVGNIFVNDFDIYNEEQAFQILINEFRSQAFIHPNKTKFHFYLTGTVRLSTDFYEQKFSNGIDHKMYHFYILIYNH